LLTTPSEACAEVSLPVILAFKSDGTAMAAMTLMIATTMSNSMSVKPLSVLPFMSVSCMSSAGAQAQVATSVPPGALGVLSV